MGSRTLVRPPRVMEAHGPGEGREEQRGGLVGPPGMVLLLTATGSAAAAAGPAGGALAQVQEGMAGEDRAGEKVGTVRRVYLGGEDLGETAVAGDSVLAEVPAGLRSRLAREGFVEIATGLLQPNRYASGAQVAAVEGDRVVLNVGRDELARK